MLISENATAEVFRTFHLKKPHGLYQNLVCSKTWAMSPNHTFWAYKTRNIFVMRTSLCFMVLSLWYRKYNSLCSKTLSSIVFPCSRAAYDTSRIVIRCSASSNHRSIQWHCKGGFSSVTFHITNDFDPQGFYDYKVQGHYKMWDKLDMLRLVIL